MGLVVVAPDLIPAVFGSQWEVSVGIIQILSVYVIIRCLQSWGSVLLDAVGRPQVTLWTQLAALCTTPLGVVIGAQWGIEAVAVGFVLSQLIAVEIPVLIIVLSELRISLSSVAARLYGVAAATLVMATICFVERQALSALGAGVEERAALTVGFALARVRDRSLVARPRYRSSGYRHRAEAGRQGPGSPSANAPGDPVECPGQGTSRSRGLSACCDRFRRGASPSS